MCAAQLVCDSDAVSSRRPGIVLLLILLFAILYLDRVCISVAGPRMQEELGIDPVGWGWVTGVFTLAYALFEIPTGVMGDRLGARRVLARVVGWWSLFTALTGAVTGFLPLLVVRFLFGAGEAGAFPNASIVVARWFTAAQRATISGVNLMAGQMGGALAPLLVLPIQQRWGWRASFVIFGGVGVLWVAAWLVYYRDTPDDHDVATPSVAAAVERTTHAVFPWREAFRSRTVLAVLLLAACYIYVYSFFQTWFHTFLVKGRGFGEGALWLSALPYLVAVLSNLAGGWTSDALTKHWGSGRGRRVVGVASLTVAAGAVTAAYVARDPYWTLGWLSLCYGAITFQQPGVFGVCLDVGQGHAGAVVGLMNTASQSGGFVGSVAYGYIVSRAGNYDAPFVPMAIVLAIGALAWTAVDASQPIAARALAANPAPATPQKTV